MTHTDLCRITAERFVRMFAIYETKIQGLPELPDVITWDGFITTTVYEIKMSRADFLADFKKKARQAKRQCGDYRYYVCNGDFIKPEELPPGWGLYWYIDGKFLFQKGSCDCCPHIRRYQLEKMRPYDHKAWHLEARILTHQIVCGAAYGLNNIVFNKRYKGPIKRLKEQVKDEAGSGAPPESPPGDHQQAR